MILWVGSTCFITFSWTAYSLAILPPGAGFMYLLKLHNTLRTHRPDGSHPWVFIPGFLSLDFKSLDFKSLGFHSLYSYPCPFQSLYFVKSGKHARKVQIHNISHFSVQFHHTNHYIFLAVRDKRMQGWQNAGI